MTGDPPDKVTPFNEHCEPRIDTLLDRLRAEINKSRLPYATIIGTLQLLQHELLIEMDEKRG